MRILSRDVLDLNVVHIKETMAVKIINTPIIDKKPPSKMQSKSHNKNGPPIRPP